MWLTMKKGILFLSLSLLALPAYGLSLGAITVDSGLNQPLQAEIPINDMQPVSLLDVTVELASHEVHRQYGIERVSVLRKLRFNVIRNEQGQFVIRLTTLGSIREPVLEFVLNVSNQNSTFRRGYAIHLDPPVF